MGVLDDAIREHLDLKRRHGVGEEELRRQEEEALGPARREVAPAEGEADETDARCGRSGRRRGAAPRRRPTAPEDDGGAGARGAGRGPSPSPRPRSTRSLSSSPSPSSRPASRTSPRRPSALGRPRPAASRRSTTTSCWPRTRTEGRPRRARGHAGLPPGDARARPALVRAEAAARLRLRLSPTARDPGREGVAAGTARPGGPRAWLQPSGAQRRLTRRNPPCRRYSASRLAARGA